MRYFLDTNVLLEDLESYSSLPFLISSETLIELEKIKTNKHKTEDIRIAAKDAIKWLSEHHDCYEVVWFVDSIYDELSNRGISYLYEQPDIIICGCAWLSTKLYDEEIIFVTHDLSCKNIADKIFELNVQWFNNKEEIYKGYKTISGDTEYINEQMSNIDYSKWYTNEYCLIHNTDDDTIREMKFDGNLFVPLKLPPSKYIKGKNPLQRCALDMLNNPAITVCAILGNYGSGKTALTMRMSIYAVKEKGWQSQILGVREPHGEGKEVGFLPGDLNMKTDFFFAPLVDQLEGGEFEIERMKQQGILEENIPYYLKGRTFNNTCLIVDEAEDMTEKQIRLIGTRVGDNSRIFFNGDHQQSTIDPTKNNALVKMCKELRGNSNFATIYLETDVRSETSKMFANLFKK